MRILGVDYGDKYVGLAMCDPMEMIATPLTTIYRDEEVNLKATVRQIRALCEENEIKLIVLGLPKNMNNTEGQRAEKSRAFKKRLERDLYLVDVLLWDERLTTREAEIPLLESGMRREQRKKVVDKMAAAIILQSYLDWKKTQQDHE